MNRIENKFKGLKKARRKAFIAFITAGFPDLKVTEKLILEFSRIGVDIIELGVAFSDPMADGLIIQEASQLALKNDTNLDKIFALVKRVRRKTEVPICLMTYYNPIFCFGEERFIRTARDHGVDGVIIPDLPPDEGRLFIQSAAKYGLDVILFIAPTTSKKRVKYIAKKARGFIYYVSLTGVTGPRSVLPKDLIRDLKAVKKLVSKPLCVGFGVSAPRQVQEIQRVADGVIVGSAILRKIKENVGRPDLIKRVGNFVSGLKR